MPSQARVQHRRRNSCTELGEQVDFEGEPVIDQDGYMFRVIKVRPRQEIPHWQIERIDT